MPVGCRPLVNQSILEIRLRIGEEVASENTITENTRPARHLLGFFIAQDVSLFETFLGDVLCVCSLRCSCSCWGIVLSCLSNVKGQPAVEREGGRRYQETMTQCQSYWVCCWSERRERMFIWTVSSFAPLIYTRNKGWRWRGRTFFNRLFSLPVLRPNIVRTTKAKTKMEFTK